MKKILASLLIFSALSLTTAQSMDVGTTACRQSQLLRFFFTDPSHHRSIHLYNPQTLLYRLMLRAETSNLVSDESKAQDDIARPYVCFYSCNNRTKQWQRAGYLAACITALHSSKKISEQEAAAVAAMLEALKSFPRTATASLTDRIRILASLQESLQAAQENPYQEPAKTVEDEQEIEAAEEVEELPQYLRKRHSKRRRRGSGHHHRGKKKKNPKPKKVTTEHQSDDEEEEEVLSCCQRLARLIGINY